MKRRTFLKSAAMGLAASRVGTAAPVASAKPPNILLAISDDQSWAHAGVYGDPVVKTPITDRLARDGVRFQHAFCSSPSCTPSRGALLTGRNFWELEEGACLHSTLPAHFDVYPGLLQAAGYHAGHTGKGWGPGKVEPGGRTLNPAGQGYASFEAFLDARPEGAPFCFWFGSKDRTARTRRGLAPTREWTPRR